MELRIPSGRAVQANSLTRIFTFFATFVLFGVSGHAQIPTCNLNATFSTVHAEGIAEKLGDILFSCSGATPNAHLQPSVYLGLNVNITNRVDSNGNTDITVLVDSGSGFVATGVSMQPSGSSTVVAQGIPLTVPATGQIAIKLQNIRAAAAQIVPSQSAPTLIQASAVMGGGFVLNNSQVPVATVNPSVLASFLNNGVPCSGSPVPSAIDLSTLFATGTSVSVIRVTEGSLAAFSRPDSTAVNGTRIVLTINGYGNGARVFVPDGIVGNSGSIPTGANAFGFSAQAGVYVPGGTSSLLLARVNGADANGAGGSVAFSLPTQQTTFNSASEIQLTNGSGTATFEILDSNDGYREDAHFPIFVSVPQTSCTSATPVNTVTAQIGPVSNVLTSSGSAPIPRYIAAVAASDCTVLGDCGSTYYPQLSVNTMPIGITGASFGPAQNASIAVGNNGPGLLTYKISAAYPSGASAVNWLSVSPTTGVNGQTVQLTADPGQLTQGTYNATVIVDAGQYGIQQVPVTFTVGVPGVTIQSVVSAATFTKGGPLTAGSIAALFGLNLTGSNVSVSFDGLSATIFGTYNVSGGQQQINLLVPSGLGTKTTSTVVVTVNGVLSNSYTVTLAANSPGIFNPGILNQNFSVNAPAAPIKVGSYVYVYLTGLAVPLTGQVTLKIGSLDLLIPQYAGAAPTLSGVQQVNVLVPSQLTFTGNSTTLSVCIPALDPTQRLCSPPATLYVSQ